MDPTCGTHWADYTCTKEEPPDLQTIRSFFEHRIATLQSNPHTAKKSSNAVPSTSKPKDKSRPAVYHARETSYDPLCPACSEDHSVYQCPSFKEWPLDKRFSIHKKKHLCLNCLGRRHSRDSCQSKKTCRECSGRHHTMLHRPDNASDSPPSDQPKPQGTRVLCANGRVMHQTFSFTFPLTALVTVKADASQQRTRALLDPGAIINPSSRHGRLTC